MALSTPRRRWVGRTPTIGDAGHRHLGAARHGEVERVGTGRADELIAVDGGEDPRDLGHQALVADLLVLGVVAEGGEADARERLELVLLDPPDLDVHGP